MGRSAACISRANRGRAGRGFTLLQQTRHRSATVNGRFLKASVRLSGARRAAQGAFFRRLPADSRGRQRALSVSYGTEEAVAGNNENNTRGQAARARVGCFRWMTRRSDMQALSDATRDRTDHPSLSRAICFSFPPTQRKGLLDPTTSKRSSNQRANLQRSYCKLLDALNVAPLQQTTA